MNEKKVKGYLCLDIETGGHTEMDDIIQFSAVVLEGAPLKEVDTYDIRLRPEKPMMPLAKAIHGISDEEASNFQPASGGFKKICDIFERYGSGHVCLGYNHVAYDLPMLNTTSLRYGIELPKFAHAPLDVMLLAKKVIPITECGNYKLDTIYVTLFPNKLEELMQKRAAHDALDDVRLTLEVFKGLVKRLRSQGEKTSLAALYKKISDPVIVEYWPFGDCKGEKVTSVVAKYGFNGRSIVTWFLNKKDMHSKYPDLLYTLRKLM